MMLKTFDTAFSHASESLRLASGRFCLVVQVDTVGVELF